MPAAKAATGRPSDRGRRSQSFEKRLERRKPFSPIRIEDRFHLIAVESKIRKKDWPELGIPAAWFGRPQKAHEDAREAMIAKMRNILKGKAIEIPDDFFSAKVDAYAAKALVAKFHHARMSNPDLLGQEELGADGPRLIVSKERGKVLASLIEFLTDRSTQTCFFLEGAPGDGKTTILKHFLRHSAQHCVDHFIYIDCLRHNSFELLIHRLYTRFHPGQKTFPVLKEAIDAIRHFVRETRELWLVVLDNAQMLEGFDGAGYHTIRNDNFTGLLLALGEKVGEKECRCRFVIGTTATPNIRPPAKLAYMPRLKVKDWAKVLSRTAESPDAAKLLKQLAKQDQKLHDHELPGTFMTVAGAILRLQPDDNIYDHVARRLHRRNLRDLVSMLFKTIVAKNLLEIALVLGLVALVEDGLKQSTLAKILDTLASRGQVPPVRDLSALLKATAKTLGGVFHVGVSEPIKQANGRVSIEPWYDVHATIRRIVLRCWERGELPKDLTLVLKREAHAVISSIAQDAKIQSAAGRNRGYVSALQRDIQSFVHLLASIDPRDGSIRSDGLTPDEQAIGRQRAIAALKALDDDLGERAKKLDKINADPVRLALLLRLYHVGYLEPPSDHPLRSRPPLLSEACNLQCGGWTEDNRQIKLLATIALAAIRYHEFAIANRAIDIGLRQARKHNLLTEEHEFSRTQIDVFNMQGRLELAQDRAAKIIAEHRARLLPGNRDAAISDFSSRLALVRSLYGRQAQSMLLTGRIHLAGLALQRAIQGDDLKDLEQDLSPEQRAVWRRVFERPQESRARWLVRYAARVTSLYAQDGLPGFISDNRFGGLSAARYFEIAAKSTSEPELQHEDREREKVGILLDRLVLARARIIRDQPIKIEDLKQLADTTFRQIGDELCLNRVTSTMTILYRLERVRTAWFIHRWPIREALDDQPVKSRELAAELGSWLKQVVAEADARGLAILSCDAKLLALQLRCGPHDGRGQLRDRARDQLQDLLRSIERCGYGLRWLEFQELLANRDTTTTLAW